MGSNIHFSKMPTVSIGRSKWRTNSNIKTTFAHGKLIPLMAFYAMPADNISIKLGDLIRMNTPIAPVMDNIYCNFHVFEIPLRLVWSHVEEWSGVNKTSSGVQSTQYQIPNVDIFANGVPTQSVSDYLAKPVVAADGNKHFNLEILKERAYWLVWSRYFRHQQIDEPFICTKDDTGTIGYINGVEITTASDPGPVCKPYDLFTASTLSPQFGSDVELPLGDIAPVYGTGEKIRFTVGTGDSALTKTASTLANTGSFTNIGLESNTLTEYNPIRTATKEAATEEFGAPYYADLQNATAAKINQLRAAFALQHYYERANFAGNSYSGVIKAHFGVTAPAGLVQEPVLIGGTKHPINISQVLSTAGYAAGSTSTVGQPGAVSVTGHNAHLCSHSVVERSIILVTVETKHAHTYGQGALIEDMKKDLIDFYSPEFANIGDQPIKKAALMVTGSSTDNEIFGYNEAWAEDRYIYPDRATGYLNPNVTGALDFWTLGDKFASVPELDSDFIHENRNSIQRVLTTGASTAFDYIGDFFFDINLVRAMPVYSIPAVLDHFGM